jgi:hypothetical protein
VGNVPLWEEGIPSLAEWTTYQAEVAGAMDAP